MRKGVKYAINDRLPLEWYEVLRKNRCLRKVLNYIYRDNIPLAWRNKVMYKKSIERIEHLFKNTEFIDCFDARNTDEGIVYWEDINQQIKDHIEQCR